MFAVVQVQGSSRTVITSRIHLLVKTFLMYLDMSLTYHDMFLMYLEGVPLLYLLNLLHSVPHLLLSATLHQSGCISYISRTHTARFPALLVVQQQQNNSNKNACHWMSNMKSKLRGCQLAVLLVCHPIITPLTQAIGLAVLLHECGRRYNSAA